MTANSMSSHGPGVAVVGDTGVGKSALINAILGQEVAETGIGWPVSSGVAPYDDLTSGLTLWDTEGFHPGSTQPSLSLRRVLRHLRRTGEGLDVVWYCWSATSHRVTNGQLDAIRYLRRQDLLVVGVLTKVRVADGAIRPADTEFAQRISDVTTGLANRKVFLTSALSDRSGAGTPHGLDDLISCTQSLLSHRSESSWV